MEGHRMLGGQGFRAQEQPGELGTQTGRRAQRTPTVRAGSRACGSACSATCDLLS